MCIWHNICHLNECKWWERMGYFVWLCYGHPNSVQSEQPININAKGNVCTYSGRVRDILSSLSSLYIVSFSLGYCVYIVIGADQKQLDNHSLSYHVGMQLSIRWFRRAWKGLTTALLIVSLCVWLINLDRKHYQLSKVKKLLKMCHIW